MKILNILRGISGEFELNRVIGAFGAAIYVIGAHAFEAWNMWRGVPFDVTAYCLAFPGGLGVAVGSIAGAVALKDRSVATSTIMRDTGSRPGTAADGAPGPPPPEKDA